MAEMTTIDIPVADISPRVRTSSKVITKGVPTVVDEPVTQYVIEEAVAAGQAEILVVTSHNKK